MKKIMVVDDEIDIRTVVKEILESNGYKVTSAKSGSECLQLLKKEKPDLILMDILMPGIPINKVLPKLKNIKVIIFSVISSSEQKISETGETKPNSKVFPNIVDYIHKPFGLKELLIKVKNALD